MPVLGASALKPRKFLGTRLELQDDGSMEPIIAHTGDTNWSVGVQEDFEAGDDSWFVRPVIEESSSTDSVSGDASASEDDKMIHDDEEKRGQSREVAEKSQALLPQQSTTEHIKTTLSLRLGFVPKSAATTETRIMGKVIDQQRRLRV